MTGEDLFAGFCCLWLVSGVLLLAARIVGGIRDLDRLKSLKLQERQFLDESVQTTQMMAQESDAIGGQCAESQGLIKVWERRLSDLARKPIVMLRLAGREGPQPSDRLWVANYLAGSRASYCAAWAEDETQARTKLAAAFASDLGLPEAVLSLAAFKSSLFA